MRVVALSFACNNACVFCAQGKLREGPAVDPQAAVDQAAASLTAGETVALVGGEPTLDDRLPSFVRALDAAGARRIVVQTNGRRLAYRAYAKALREASAKVALDVSIAGSTGPMHDYHTGVPGSFQQTVLGLRNARAEEIAASASCVVTRSNFRHLREIVQLAHAVGVGALRFVAAQPLGSARVNRDRVVPAPELVAPYLALALAEARRLAFSATVSETGDPEETAAGAFVGLGPVETAAVTDAALTGAGLTEATAATAAEPAAAPRRSLAIFGRPSPGRREERTPSRRTGDDLRAIFPTLFEGAPPRDVADVVAAAATDGGE